MTLRRVFTSTALLLMWTHPPAQAALHCGDGHFNLWYAGVLVDTTSARSGVVEGMHTSEVGDLQTKYCGKDWSLIGDLSGVLPASCSTYPIPAEITTIGCMTQITSTCAQLEGSWIGTTTATIGDLDPKTEQDIKSVRCGPREPPGDRGTDQPPVGTPIVIDVAGDGFLFTGLSSPVQFDIDADGDLDETSWTGWNSDDAFLTLDRNGNSRVDSGAELFGNVTYQPPSEGPNGFLALAVLDRWDWGGNGDGIISPEDSAYSMLRLWMDRNRDGRSQETELSTLSEADIRSIDLAYISSHRQDRYGNLLRWLGWVDLAGKRRLLAVDVIFIAPR